MTLYDDAIILAKTVVEPDEWWYRDYDEHGYLIYRCNFCGASSENIEPNNTKSIIHKPDCPVLVAMDILTRRIDNVNT